MENLYNLFIDPLHQTFFQKALLGGSLIAIACGVIGCFVILRRMAFLGDALSHAMIAGVVGGYLFMKVIFSIEAHAPAMLIGSVIAALITVGLISFVSQVSRIKEDAVIGIMYCGIFASGVVLVSIFRDYIHVDIMHFIMGDILGITDSELWVAAIVSAFVLTILMFFYRHLQLATFDPIMATSIGISVALIDYSLTACVSMVVVSAVSMVGVILVVGLLITPAATAYLLSDRLPRMMALAALFSFTSVVGGLYLSVWLDSAGGGAIMLFCSFQFFVIFLLAPKYGYFSKLIRRWNMIPQSLLEDILTSVLRSGNQASSESLRLYLKSSTKLLVKGVNQLQREELIIKTGKQIKLTDKGKEQANKIIRAHRLWESYLEATGMPANEVHRAAHHLEHLKDEAAINYLDNKLGHPAHDPHGKKIPQ
ncbi:MAG: metal ABC transporter permease [Oligoflexia bacterium]|nr:metal ABC transporter permease [Oligoflexia bacterium]MBF0364075.1 metal ABC transporter permease [Oligoflexia bacterium]